MRPRWEDVNARARGLSARLLAPEVLDGLSQVRGMAGLGRALAAQDFLDSRLYAADHDHILRPRASRR